MYPFHKIDHKKLCYSSPLRTGGIHNNIVHVAASTESDGNSYQFVQYKIPQNQKLLTDFYDFLVLHFLGRGVASSEILGDAWDESAARETTQACGL